MHIWPLLVLSPLIPREGPSSVGAYETWKAEIPWAFPLNFLLHCSRCDARELVPLGYNYVGIGLNGLECSSAGFARVQ